LRSSSARRQLVEGAQHAEAWGRAGADRGQPAGLAQRLQRRQLVEQARVLERDRDPPDREARGQGLDDADQHRHAGDQRQALVRDVARARDRIVRAAAAGEHERGEPRALGCRLAHASAFS
jgi:hypothetical protein